MQGVLERWRKTITQGAKQAAGVSFLLGQPGICGAVLRIDDLQIEHDRLQIQQGFRVCGVDEQLERFAAYMCCPQSKILLCVTHLLQAFVSGRQVLQKVLAGTAQIDLAPPFVAVFPGLRALIARRAAITSLNGSAHVRALEHVRQQQQAPGDGVAADLRLFKVALFKVGFDLAQVLMRAQRITAHRCWQLLCFALCTAQRGDGLGNLDLVFVGALPFPKSRLIGGQLHAQVVENGERVIEGNDQRTVLIVDAALPEDIGAQRCP
ncbi:hypothetical protein ALQ49_200094 [Pseudomonas syringae pv. apii]|uniref:Uncharacterized protein n=1 Tax=Pseudomonas syringae pv. apii TaxID=81036 RepID=A0A3M3R7I8_9PSED|nr:hypothetical protein ALQ49_200094 [Pseudomonas syringae pv. apii]